MKISVIIKALNEEKNIARAIESSLKALASFSSSEVILADSLSTDKTIEIAKKYPIKIVQLKNMGDRSCGIGAELGFNIAKGEYIYILDADMTFQEGFLEKAVSFLDENQGYAGVAGMIEEMSCIGIEFQERYKRKHSGLGEGEVNSLNMGGLFRRKALLQSGYFTNRNLNSYEEAELGARLNILGWKLKRILEPSVKHYGHEDDSYRLLFKRVKSGYIFGLGELFRSALGEPYFSFLVKNTPQLKLYFLYLVWILSVIFLSFNVLLGGVVSVFLLILVFAFPFIGMSFKKKSIRVGIYSVVSAIFYSIGTLVGFLKKQAASPFSSIDYSIVK